MQRASVLSRLIHREPVAVQGFIQAGLATLVGFGVINWSSEQVGLFLGFVAATLALFTRGLVSPSGEAKPPTPARHTGERLRD